MVFVLLLQLYVGPPDLNIPTWATPASFNAATVPFCRGHYTSDRYEANGSGWSTDHPGADINLLVRLGEITTIRPGKQVVVRLTSPLLVQCPVLYMSDVGTMSLSVAEVAGLRNYLLRGGFLWVDDFWGSDAWDQWVVEIRKVLPTQQMFTFEKNHPIFHQQYSTDGIWQMPNNGLWRVMDGDTVVHSTSERGEDSETATMRGILDDKGRLIVIMTHNTDVGDGWEQDGSDDVEYLRAFSHKSYMLGVNVWLYALSH